MNDQNHGPELMIGGLILFVILGAFLLKALKSLMNELAHAFSAFAAMTGSFAVMLFGILKVVVVVALIAGVIVAAVYFTYRYVKMVRRATEVIKRCDERVDLLETSVANKMDSLLNEVNEARDQVSKLAHRLDKALEPAKLVPEAMPKTVAGSPEGQNSEPLKTDPAGKLAGTEKPIASFNPF